MKNVSELCECLFHTSPVCFSLQPRSPGREQWAGWERAATHVKPHCLTFIGSAKNVDLWCVWTVTRPRRGRAPKVSHRFHIHLWTLTVLVHSFCWYVVGLKTLTELEKCPRYLKCERGKICSQFFWFIYVIYIFEQ